MDFYYRTAWDTAVDARQADSRRRLLPGMSQLWRLTYSVDIIKQKQTERILNVNMTKFATFTSIFKSNVGQIQAVKIFPPMEKIVFSFSPTQMQHIFHFKSFNRFCWVWIRSGGNWAWMRNKHILKMKEKQPIYKWRHFLADLIVHYFMGSLFSAENFKLENQNRIHHPGGSEHRVIDTCVRVFRSFLPFCI